MIAGREVLVLDYDLALLFQPMLLLGIGVEFATRSIRVDDKIIKAPIV